MWSRQGRGRASLPQLLRQFHDSKSGTIGRRHAGDYPDLGQRLGTPVHPMGRARGAFDPWAAGLSGRGEPSPVRAACRAGENAAIPRSAQSAGICRAHHAAHAYRHGAVAALHLHLCDTCRQEQTRRAALGPAARYSAIGPDPRLHLGHGGVLHGAGARPRARRRIRLDLRHLHQSGLEHGVQLLPVLAHGADRARRSVTQFPAQWMDEILASRCAVRHAAADLEHDDVDVGGLVLRRRLRGDQRRQHHGHASRRRLLHRLGHRAPGSASGDMGDRDHAGGHPDLRPGPVPAAGGMGGSLPLRTGSRRAAAALMGIRRLAPIAHRRAADPTLRRAMAAHAAAAAARQTPIQQANAAARAEPHRVPIRPHRRCA